MADSNDRGGFLRLGLRPKAPTSTKSVAVVESKATPSSLLPRYWPVVRYGQGFTPDFIPLDNRGNVVDVTDGATTIAFAAYWYIATRWRAQKLAEAPLMVVEEDQDDGSEEWLADHDLAPLLEQPNPDFDMGDLIERTSKILDNEAEAIWVIDRDGIDRAGRLTPFARSEFEVVRTADRLFGEFKIRTAAGEKTFPADRVIYFRDSIDNWGGSRGRSRLDHAMAWLRLGEKARATVRDLLDNAVWPSGVAIPDVNWNPDEKMLQMFQEELNSYAQPGEKGKAFAMLGGGRFEQMAARIRDLVPTEVLDRVESVVAAVAGVPAIVLQFQIGLENSPWSQMEQARRMAYDDTIAPTWRKWERLLTRQLLRTQDEDPTRFVRFDTTGIAALQINQLEAATIASMMGRQASLNERRAKMGLDPLDDPRADEVPELTQPDPMSLAAGAGDDGDGSDSEDQADEENDLPPEKRSRRAIEAKRRRLKRRRVKVAQLSIALRNESAGGFEHFANRLLANDANEVEKIVRNNLVEAKAKGRNADSVMRAVLGYIRGTSEPAWAKASQPAVQIATERATAVIAADVGVSFNLLHPHVVKFAREETAFLVKGVSATTIDGIQAVLSAGIEAGKSTATIAREIAESGSFAPSRARLIARTESTRASNGGPVESLKSYGKASGRRYTKTWADAGDARVRDEHRAMDGETVDIDEKFSNGLAYPSEPNCRCAVIFNEVTA